MLANIVPGLVIAILFVAMLFGRNRSRRWHLAVDAASLTAISLCFMLRGGTPLIFAGSTPVSAAGFMDRTLAAAWWVFAGRVAATLERFVLGHNRRSRETKLFSDLLAGSIYIAIALIVLDLILRLPIGGFVATSGVVAIVLGLALQNTLADVFSGIAVGIEKPFRVGDRVSLGGGVEGNVVQVNWRSIRIETDANDLAVIPNSQVAKASILNLSSPSARRTGNAELTATAAADPDLVMELLRRAALLCPDIVAHPPPSFQISRLGERNNGFIATFGAEDSTRLAKTKGELLRQMRRQLHHAGLLPATCPSAETGIPAQPGGRLLRETTLFASLDADGLNDLCAKLQVRALQVDDLMFEQGQVDATLYLIADGVFELSRSTKEGARELTGRIGPGEYIGEIGLLTGEPRMVTVKALTSATVFALSHEALAPLIQGRTDVAIALDQAVRRGIGALHRDAAARTAEQLGIGGQLLAQIRRFFDS